MVLWDRNNSSAISGNERWVGSSGSRRSSAAVSADAPGDAGTAFFRQPGLKRLGLAGQGAEAGPAPEQVVDLPHERPGTCEVGECEVDAGELDPRLNGEVRECVGQQMP